MELRHPGQGIHFIGYPTDVQEFYWILAVHGCHPKAADRILSRLKDKGEDRLTIMTAVPFEVVKRELSQIGIQLIQIDPIEFNGAEDGEWPEEVLEKVFAHKAKNI